MRRVPVLVPPLVAAAACVLFGSTIAFASALGVSPQGLTVIDAAASVPPSTCELTAVADAHVDGGVLDSGSNFGTGSSLSVRSSALGNRRTFVRFDLPACPGLAGARVTAASLHLVAGASAAGRTYDAHRVQASWAETAITWDNQPAVAPAATASAGSAAGELSWNVAADVEAFAAGTASSFGWQVRDRSEGSLLDATTSFAARESGAAADRPRLEIVYYP